MEDSVMISATKVEAMEKNEEENTKSCCVISIAEDGKKCCKSKAKNGQLLDSGLSQVLLGVVENNERKLTRHETRFGITSFVYRARRPFHPGRLYDDFLEPFFMFRYLKEDDPEGQSSLDEIQKQAAFKQAKRIEVMGELLRSKGFIWIATSNYIMGGFQQAGNILRIEAQGPWMCENAEQWEGTPNEALIYKDMVKENGEEWPYMDRRQELVFIGHRVNNEAIQKALDHCLLNDDEMNMGPEKWEESMASLDKIQMSLDYDVDEDETDEEENDEEEEEGPPTKRSKRDEKTSQSNGETRSR